MALKIKVGPIGAFDMLKFKKQPDKRRKKIAATVAEPLPKIYATNRRAQKLHPKVQQLQIEKITEHSADVKTYLLKKTNNKAAAYFRAGQYLSIVLEIGSSKLTRPYSISSAPALALSGQYEITVKRLAEGFASDFILDNWQVGDVVTASDPQGNFYYDDLRDQPTIVGLAGGSGITPFLSMASAIRDGAEDFDLLVLYGSRREQDILFLQEFTEIAAYCPRVRLVNVLSDEQKQGFEHGFISAELIAKYAPANYSLFVCGPKEMYRFAEQEIAKLGLAAKNVRFELLGAEKQPWLLPGYPAAAREATYQLLVKQCGQTQQIPAKGCEPLLVALERAGITAPSHCRSGECGYCHSKLCRGEVFIPEDTDGRRAGDLAYGYIHPCVTFPTSDLEIELPGAYV